jgi:hypothetical protein
VVRKAGKSHSISAGLIIGGKVGLPIAARPLPSLAGCVPNTHVTLRLCVSVCVCVRLPMRA